MEKAADREDLLNKIAEYLSCGREVRFNYDTLEYGVLLPLEPDEYNELMYVDEFPDKFDERMRDWEIDQVEYNREILALPHEIDVPWKRTQFDWMVDFANQQKNMSQRFHRDVDIALGSSHPFRNFKDVMYRHGISQEWFSYQHNCYREYVDRELRHISSSLPGI